MRISSPVSSSTTGRSGAVRSASRWRTMARCWCRKTATGRSGGLHLGEGRYATVRPQLERIKRKAPRARRGAFVLKQGRNDVGRNAEANSGGAALTPSQSGGFFLLVGLRHDQYGLFG